MLMHADQVDVPDELVRQLLDSQFPQWRSLVLRRLPPLGTDHQLFRLGEDLLVRMPVYAASAGQAESDATWLPVLAPHLPVDVPTPLAVGAPTAAYPFGWSVVPWLAGENPTQDNVDGDRLALDLADFVAALHAVDPQGGPAKTGSSRGTPLEPGDAEVREQIAGLGDVVDGQAALRVWHEAMDAGPYPGPGVWIHGDLLEGNLLVRRRRLSAVIDFGALGVADPAADYTPAWTMFEGRSRRTFLDHLGVDDASWARARAWVMLPALTGVTYYRESVPEFAERSRQHLAALFDDPKRHRSV